MPNFIVIHEPAGCWVHHNIWFRSTLKTTMILFCVPFCYCKIKKTISNMYRKIYQRMQLI